MLQSKIVATLAICLQLSIAIQRILFRRLEHDAIKQARLDPTEIIAAPFDQQLLAQNVVTAFASVLATSVFVDAVHDKLSFGTRRGGGETGTSIVALSKSAVAGSAGVLAASIPVFLLCVLSGASPLEHVPHTVLASIYVSVLAFGPPFFHPGFFDSSLGLFRLLAGTETPSSADGDDSNLAPPNPAPAPVKSRGFALKPREVVDRWAMLGVFAGNVPSSILLVLDHGSQIQRWPVPLILGSSIGFGIGSCLGVLLCIFGRFQERKSLMISPSNGDNETKQL